MLDSEFNKSNSRSKICEVVCSKSGEIISYKGPMEVLIQFWEVARDSISKEDNKYLWFHKQLICIKSLEILENLEKLVKIRSN